MTVVPMGERHLDEIARLESLCFSEPWSRKALEEELENPTAMFLVAEENGVVLGYAGMHAVCGEGYIDNIAVFPEHRRNGVARRLITELADRLSQQDGEFLTLEVRASNEAAISLYHSIGFLEVGRRPRFYTNPTEDALLLTFSLRNQ